ncbi:LacI family DNA-binding transcriptional regulator [Cryobacterium sp. SO1]|uniref:LacI family DNA-binding transcriptional regulator n=1 Tax=Cryobacterium sp. SO1 TaxID=1897061 RepID=UPI001023E189|nr:LacI family DNA-binding transcriptional regulator [Cryobacterium sp. SO1]
MGKDREPTIYAVAERAGVSKSVVSRVVSGRGSVSLSARERVLTAADDLGYRVNLTAQALRSGRGQLVGLLLRSSVSPFYGRLMYELQREASAENARLVAVTGNLDDASEREALETLLELRVAAVIIGSGRIPAAVVNDVAARVPTIMIEREQGSVLTDIVGFDGTLVGRETVERLWDAGHRAVYFFDHLLSASAVPRRVGFMSAAEERGLHVTVVDAGYDYIPGLVVASRTFAELRNNPAISAVVTLGHEAAEAVLETAAQLKVSVPGDLTVVTLALPDEALSGQWDLTGFRSDTAELAGAVWSLLRSRLADPDRPTSAVAVPRHLHEGNTFGAATASVMR